MVWMRQGCAKQVGFDTNIGFDIENSRKYRYRIGIGYEIAREWISKSISFRNNELTDIGFVFDFEILNGRILEHFRDNFWRAYVVKYRFRNRYRFEIWAKIRLF